MNKVIDIRIVIIVPERDVLFIPEAVEKISGFVKSLFPSFEKPKKDSPITVTIKDMSDETKP